jgi:hypothetical protein
LKREREAQFFRCYEENVSASLCRKWPATYLRSRMSHLEDIIAEFYDWQGYLIKRNVKVGRRARGGWAMELDVIAYHPHTEHLIHLEPSLDAHSWAKREQRFRKKFAAGAKYIFSEVYTWLDPKTPIDQVAVLISHPTNRDRLAGGRVRSVDEFFSEVRSEIAKLGLVSKNAVPEIYPLLRTIQLAQNGYYRVVGPLP